MGEGGRNETNEVKMRENVSEDIKSLFEYLSRKTPDRRKTHARTPSRTGIYPQPIRYDEHETA
jgi:hypothetical protein